MNSLILFVTLYLQANTRDVKLTASSGLSVSSKIIANVTNTNSVSPFSDATSVSDINRSTTERDTTSFPRVTSQPGTNKTEPQPTPSATSSFFFASHVNNTGNQLSIPPIPHITPTPTFNFSDPRYHRLGESQRQSSSRFEGNRNGLNITSFSHNTADALYQNQNPYNTTLFPYDIYPPNSSLESRCGSSWLSEKSHSPVVPPAASPCCLNCTLFGGDVQVFVWPTPRPTPLVNTVVDESGYTL